MWRFHQNPTSFAGLSLLVSLSLIRALKRLTQTEFSVKWPNDILFKFQKIAGILIECRTNTRQETTAIIGIGINIKSPINVNFPSRYPYTDLYTAVNRNFDRNELLALILTELHHLLSAFESSSFKSFHAEWQRYHCFQNKMVSLIFPNNTSVEGVVNGITEEGELILDTGSSKLTYAIGEISLRLKKDDYLNTCN